MLTLTKPPSDGTAKDDPDCLHDIAAEFHRLRPRLLGIATRILRDRAEAEDIVQDAWIRWQTCDRTRVSNPTAFLVTTTTRLALNAAQTARARHERPVGTLLPEPVERTEDFAHRLECDEALDVGIQVLLQRLTTAERAAFVLRQAFEYPYGRIAGVLGTSETNARQLVSRATKHLAQQGGAAAEPDHPQLLPAFVAAARHGHVQVLERVLAPAAAAA